MSALSRAKVAMGRRIILSSRKRGKHSHFARRYGRARASRPHARPDFAEITRALTLPWKPRNFRTMKWGGACPS